MSERTSKSGASRRAGQAIPATQYCRASTKTSSAKSGATSSGRNAARGGLRVDDTHIPPAPASNSKRKNAGTKPAAKGHTRSVTQNANALRTTIPAKAGAARQTRVEIHALTASGSPCHVETHWSNARIRRVGNGAAPVPASGRGGSAMTSLSPTRDVPSAKPAARKAAGTDHKPGAHQGPSVDPVTSGRKPGARGLNFADTHYKHAAREKCGRKAADRGQIPEDTQKPDASVISRRKASALYQASFVTRQGHVRRDNFGSDADDGGQCDHGAHCNLAPAELSDLCHRIRVLHRDHKGLQVAVGDMIRRIKSEERWCAAQRVLAAGGQIEDGKFPVVEDEDRRLAAELHPRYLAARDGLEELRKQAAAELSEAVFRLPVAEWVEAIPGCGIGQLGIVVGECGDLGRYATVSKLWKYAGLAVINGRAQGRVARGDREGAEAQKYAPKRRSSMFQVSIAWGMGKGPYGELIRKRKAYEVATQTALGKKIVPAAVISAAKARGKDVSMMMSEGHIAKRARRYAEKRFLRDLWVAWREARMSMQTQADAAAAEFPMAAE